MAGVLQHSKEGLQDLQALEKASVGVVERGGYVKCQDPLPIPPVGGVSHYSLYLHGENGTGTQ